MRKASVHSGSGLSEERSATTLPHANPRYASEPTTNTHTCRHPDTQYMYVHSVAQLTCTRVYSLSDRHEQNRILYTNICAAIKT